MTIRNYVEIWLAVVLILTIEFISLTFHPEWSLIHRFNPTLTFEPGRALSLYLGWAGMIIMLLMNVYSARKRLRFMGRWGAPSQWLEFHIFCGLVGPTFILFHSDFKVRGLVAISFWSMLVSASSGIIGRYFYVQLLKKKKEIQKDIEFWSAALKQIQEEASHPITDEMLERVKKHALRFVGANPQLIREDGTFRAGLFHIFFSSILGDFRLFFNPPKTLRGMPVASRLVLRNYALSVRYQLFLDPFRNLMGYWHAFHTPFAAFMYGAAIIHIATALILGVKR